MLKCKICDYEGEMKIINANIKDIGDRKVLSCPNCKFQFVYPSLTSEEKSEIYDSSEYTAFINENDDFIPIKKSKFKKLLNNVIKYKNKCKILDVGCGMGHFLEVANTYGFDTYGIELSKFAAKVSAQHSGEDKIYQGIIEDCKWENMFELILMNDFIEHTDNPIEVLKSANRLLRNDTDCYVMITTVNTDSIVYKIMKTQWAHYRLDHLSYFNNKVIYEMANKSGFEVIKIKPYFKILTFRYVNYILKADFEGINNKIFNILEKIPIFNDMQLPLYSGESFIVLKKKTNIS